MWPCVERAASPVVGQHSQIVGGGQVFLVIYIQKNWELIGGLAYM